MTPDAWLTVGIISVVIAALLTNRIGVDVAMLGGLTLIMLLNILSPEQAVAGFAHPAIIMIGALFVVAAGLQETGGIEAIAQRILGRPKSIAGAQLRLMAPVALISGLINNTPIVAMYLPIVNDWARRMRISPSKLYMPLSFAAILGGKLTYVGTASNIVVMAMYAQFLADAQQQQWLTSIGAETELSSLVQFWGVGAVGLPTTIAGIAFIMLASRWLLPERRSVDTLTQAARQYQVQLEVLPESPIVGKSIEQAGLRHLPGLFLTEIERDGDRLPAVAPEERLKAGDRLSFAGVLESVIDLRKIRGLVPATDQVAKVDAPGQQRTLVEAVVSTTSPLVGRTVRASQFRTRYNAAIIAVHRNGEHIHAKIGDIRLQPGDTLLLDTHLGFVNAFRNRQDFYLVSNVEGARPIRYERSWIALCIFCGVIVLLTVQLLHPVTAVLLGAMAMIGTRCVTGTIARRSINWQVLVVIGAALGMGRALRDTGAADEIAGAMIAGCEWIGLAANPHFMLLVTFLLAATFSQLVTNNGAAVLMFPVIITTTHSLGVDPRPFVIALMVAAGCSFMSPVAYQTNLMVYGPGGYRFFDYVRLGLPLTLLLAAMTTLLAPLAFPFHP